MQFSYNTGVNLILQNLHHITSLKILLHGQQDRHPPIWLQQYENVLQSEG